MRRPQLLTYQRAWENGEHRNRFGFHSYAVPIVTTSRKRAENIIALIERTEALAKSKLFLVTDLKSLLASEDLFTHPWLMRRGLTTTLVSPEALAALPFPVMASPADL